VARRSLPRIGHRAHWHAKSAKSARNRGKSGTEIGRNRKSGTDGTFSRWQSGFFSRTIKGQPAARLLTVSIPAHGRKTSRLSPDFRFCPPVSSGFPQFPPISPGGIASDGETGEPRALPIFYYEPLTGTLRWGQPPLAGRQTPACVYQQVRLKWGSTSLKVRAPTWQR